MSDMSFKESVDLLKFWFDMEADEQADADKEDEDPEYKKVVRAATFVLARVAAMEDLLCSARAICKRRGEETAWERFDDRIASFDIGCITPRVFKVLPSDVATMSAAEFVERWTDKAIQDWGPQLRDLLADLAAVKATRDALAMSSTGETK